MIDIEYTERLSELAAEHLNCTLDDYDSKYIPPDIIKGTYRWFLYIFSNLYSEENDTIEDKDRALFIYVFSIFKDIHTISWTRDTLIELDLKKLPEIEQLVQNNIATTTSFFELKVNLYVKRCLENKQFYTDSYVLTKSCNLKNLVIGVSPRFTERLNFWLEDHKNNLNMIKDSFGGRDNLKILEIGVCEGRTTLWLLENVMTGKECSIQCIDPGITKNGKMNLSFDKRVTLHEDYSKNVLLKLIDSRETFDVIYVDGDHNASATIIDGVLSWRLLRTGGLLLFGDYEMVVLDYWLYVSHKEFDTYPRLEFTHPKIAIDAFLSMYRGQYDLVINNYQIGVVKLLEA